MFELPEFATLARQMRETLTGKVIAHGSLGNAPHRFVWHNRKPEEFARLTSGKTVGLARSRGKWLFLPLEPGYVLVIGECGGRLRFHPAGDPAPPRYHLRIAFVDGSAFSALTTMWGAYDLFEQGRELEREYIRGMRPTPADPAFTPAYFSALIDEAAAAGKRSAKALLTQDQLVPGIGNSLAQDILFRAGLDPRHLVADLDKPRRRTFHRAIVKTVAEATRKGGRNDEVDLFGRPGGYARLLGKTTEGKPCPTCGTTIRKIQFLGGSAYFCPSCQT